MRLSGSYLELRIAYCEYKIIKSIVDVSLFSHASTLICFHISLHSLDFFSSLNSSVSGSHINGAQVTFIISLDGIKHWVFEGCIDCMAQYETLCKNEDVDLDCNYNVFEVLGLKLNPSDLK